MIKQKDGFAGQRAIILPQSIIKDIELHPTVSPLYITDIGYYPKASIIIGNVMRVYLSTFLFTAQVEADGTQLTI